MIIRQDAGEAHSSAVLEKGSADLQRLVITGAASGIGFAASELLIERYPAAEFCLLDQVLAPMAVLRERGGRRVRTAQCDVSDKREVERVIDDLCGSGPITGLVTCAGILRNEASLDLTAEQWREMLGVHLDGSFFAAQAVGARMKGTGGSIVLIASIAMDFGWPRRLPYAVAKAGTGAMARTLAVEWAQYGIRVNAVAPGYVDSPMIRDAIANGLVDGELRAEQHALKRLAEPREIAEVIEFLLSDRASFMTGEVVRADGGFSILK